MVPAKWMPGTVVLSHQRRLDRQAALPEGRPRPAPAGRRSGQTKPVAAMTSSTVGDQVAAAVGPSKVDVERARPRRARSGRWRHRGRSRHRPARGPRRAGRSGPGRRPGTGCRPTAWPATATTSDELARPGQEPAGQLEPRVLLADDEHATVGVGLGRPDVGVVVRHAPCPASAGCTARRRPPRRRGRGSDTRRRSSRRSKRSPSAVDTDRVAVQRQS